MWGVLLFPCCAILWLFVNEWLGLVEDEPIINAGNRKGEDE